MTDIKALIAEHLTICNENFEEDSSFRPTVEGVLKSLKDQARDTGMSLPPEIRSVAETVCRQFAESHPETTGDDLDLLPFEVYVGGLQANIPAKGYAIDKHCRVHGVDGQRRKRGLLKHQHYWYKKRGAERKFFGGYYLSLDKRRGVTDKVLGQARYAAERRRAGDGDEL